MRSPNPPQPPDLSNMGVVPDDDMTHAILDSMRLSEAMGFLGLSPDRLSEFTGIRVTKVRSILRILANRGIVTRFGSRGPNYVTTRRYP